MILNGKPFNPGELRTKVTFQIPAIVQDAGAAQSEVWTTLDTPYVKIVNAHGAEAVASDADKSTRRSTWTRRYNASVTELSSALLNGERWQVVSVDDIQNRHEYMELVMESVRGTV